MGGDFLWVERTLTVGRIPALFVPRGHDQSFAELSAETKNKLSHRAQALQKVRRYLETLGLGA